MLCLLCLLCACLPSGVCFCSPAVRPQATKVLRETPHADTRKPSTPHSRPCATAAVMCSERVSRCCCRCCRCCCIVFCYQSHCGRTSDRRREETARRRVRRRDSDAQQRRRPDRHNQQQTHRPAHWPPLRLSLQNPRESAPDSSAAPPATAHSPLGLHSRSRSLRRLDVTGRHHPTRTSRVRVQRTRARGLLNETKRPAPAPAPAARQERQERVAYDCCCYNWHLELQS